MTFYVNYETITATSMLIPRFPLLIASYAKGWSSEFPLTSVHSESCEEDNVQHWVRCMKGCWSGKLRMKATAICIIVKANYTRCLLNTREETEIQMDFFNFQYWGNFPNAVLINLTHELCTRSTVILLIFYLHFNIPLSFIYFWHLIKHE